MEFRDLKKQYLNNKSKIDQAVLDVMLSTQFIGGSPVRELEERLASYVGVKHCITCANGTDALQLALMAWGIGKGDAVLVPDFTFFATAEVAPWVGATPVFVDIEKDTFNISPQALENTIELFLKEGKLTPKVVVAVDLFGQPANYPELKKIAEKYNLLLLEDGAQGFGGSIGDHKACSFGDISTTSFFPAKPLGCYGDGGAIFTDNDEWAELISSYKVHGKGTDKYDNVRIGMNSRLDTIQAAILLAKLDDFIEKEIDAVNRVAKAYTQGLQDIVVTPYVKEGYLSSWAQYTILLESEKQRDELQEYLKKCEIPTMIYYPKGMHEQTVFTGDALQGRYVLQNTEDVCRRCLALPMHPFLENEEIQMVVSCIKKYFNI